MRYTTLIGGIIAFAAIDVQAVPVLNKSKNASRNTTIPPMPKGWMNDEFGVTSDVATAFADALTTLFVNYQNKDPDAHNVGLTYWVHRNGMDGGNMYLGLQLSNPEDGYPYLGSITPGNCDTECTYGSKGSGKYSAPLASPGYAYYTEIGLYDGIQDPSIAEALNMQMAANTPGPTFIDAFCFDLGVGTAPGYANKGHSVCFNQEVVATCATITNRWKTFSTQPPGLMWFSTIGSAYIHSVSVNNVGNMIKWEDDLLWRQNIQDALWNYCWTIDIDFGDDSDADRHTPATYLDCKSGNTCTNVKNQWVTTASCQSCYGNYAEFPPEDRGVNQGFAAVEEMPVPKMNAPESHKLREALKKFEETRAKLVAEGKWD